MSDHIDLSQTIDIDLSQTKGYTVDELEFQYNAATDLIREIRSDIDTLDELDPQFILDMLGVLGLEFKIGEAASIAFIESCRLENNILF